MRVWETKCSTPPNTGKEYTLTIYDAINTNTTLPESDCATDMVSFRPSCHQTAGGFAIAKLTRATLGTFSGNY